MSETRKSLELGRKTKAERLSFYEGYRQRIEEIDIIDGSPAALKVEIEDILFDFVRESEEGDEGPILDAIMETFNLSKYERFDYSALIRRMRKTLGLANSVEVELHKYFSPPGQFTNKKPDPREPVFIDCFNLGHKGQIVAGSKRKKSFFALQLAMSLSAGIDFLGFQVPKARKVLFCNYEIAEKDFNWRCYGMIKALGLDEGALENLMILNLRGIDTPIAAVGEVARSGGFEVVILDPLYKIFDGDESAPGDIKPVLKEFDKIVRKDIALLYVHHDPKGGGSGRNIRDRGSGSSLLNRDIDFGITISPHAEDEENMSVVETLCRSYAPRANHSVIWSEGSFLLSDAIPKVKSPHAAGGRPKKKKPESSFNVLQETAVQLSNSWGPIPFTEFKSRMKKELKIPRSEVDAVIDSLTVEGGDLAILPARTKLGEKKTIGNSLQIGWLKTTRNVKELG